MRPCVISILLIGLLSFSAFAQKVSVPTFDPKVEGARAKSINFRGNRANRTFRTRLSEALRGGINFAEYYIVAGWGCGTGCIYGAIIDARNGTVYWPRELGGVSVWFGQTDYVDEPVAYIKNSRLLVIHGTPGSDTETEDNSQQGKYYYEWKNNRLRLLKFIKQESK